MEATVYRNHEETALTRAISSSYHELLPNGPECPSSPTADVLHPGVFYPCISDIELDIWRHWLPTTIVCNREIREFPDEVVNTLDRLDAPSEVLEEYQWSRTMGLFESYEVQTPERPDLRDPLLIGICNGSRYRIALWGESLRQLEEITQLVQKSLALRRRAFRWRVGILSMVALFGVGLGLWVGQLPDFKGNPLEAVFTYVLLGLFLTGFPCLIYTPERRQQNFLDRYRC